MFQSLSTMPCRAVSTFWIAHPNNHLINNAAAGSQVNDTFLGVFILVTVLACMGGAFVMKIMILFSGPVCLIESELTEVVL